MSESRSRTVYEFKLKEDRNSPSVSIIGNCNMGEGPGHPTYMTLFLSNGDTIRQDDLWERYLPPEEHENYWKGRHVIPGKD